MTCSNGTDGCRYVGDASHECERPRKPLTEERVREIVREELGHQHDWRYRLGRRFCDCGAVEWLTVP